MITSKTLPKFKAQKIKRPIELEVSPTKKKVDMYRLRHEWEESLISKANEGSLKKEETFNLRLFEYKYEKLMRERRDQQLRLEEA